MTERIIIDSSPLEDFTIDCEEWKRITDNPNVLAVYLFGGILERPLDSYHNDLDVLIVIKKLKFSNLVNEKLLGFEHIRHDGFLDRYLTDIDHFTLAKEILRINEKCCFFKKKFSSKTKLLKVSKSFHDKHAQNYKSWSNLFKQFMKDSTSSKKNLKGILKEFTEGDCLEMDSKRVSLFWYSKASKSWLNYWNK